MNHSKHNRTVSRNILWPSAYRGLYAPERDEISDCKLPVSEHWHCLLRVLVDVRACEETGITHRPNDRHNVINFVSGDWARSGEVGEGPTTKEGWGEQRSSISGQGHVGAAAWSPPPPPPRRSVIARREISIRRPNAARFTAGTCGN